jgi:hypothetical protein
MVDEEKTVRMELRGQLIKVSENNDTENKEIEKTLEKILTKTYECANPTGKWFFPSDMFTYFQCQESLAMRMPFPRISLENQSDEKEFLYEILDQEIIEVNSPDRICFQERSGYFEGKVPPDVLKMAYNKVKEAPGKKIIAGPNGIVFFQTGGSINTIGAGDTAFVHRNNNWLMAIQAHWKVVEEGPNEVVALTWLNDFYDTMRPFTIGAYQNFPDPSLLKVEDYMNNYYGENQARLKRVKMKFDPNGLFNFPQVIT